jgi:hypothetical protein
VLAQRSQEGTCVGDAIGNGRVGSTKEKDDTMCRPAKGSLAMVFRYGKSSVQKSERTTPPLSDSSLVGVSEGERGARGGHGGRARVMRAVRGGGCGVSAGAPKSMGIMHVYVH